jgi:hypothetical protein
MLGIGDFTYEAEYRMKEASRVLAQRQAGGLVPSSRPGLALNVRKGYYRQLASLGRRVCDLGLEVGCTLEARAAATARYK